MLGHLVAAAHERVERRVLQAALNGGAQAQLEALLGYVPAYKRMAAAELRGMLAETLFEEVAGDKKIQKDLKREHEIC